MGEWRIVPQGGARSRIGVGPLHHLAFRVADLEASERFYGGVLGMRRTLQMEVSGEEFARVLQVDPQARARIWYFEGGVRLGQLELVEWLNPPASAADRPAHPTSPYDFRVMSFEVDDEEMDSLLQAAEAAGFPVFSGPESFSLPNYGPIRAAIVRDPDGHLVELVALPSAETLRAVRSKSTATTAASE